MTDNAVSTEISPDTVVMFRLRLHDISNLKPWRVHVASALEQAVGSDHRVMTVAVDHVPEWHDFVIDRSFARSLPPSLKTHQMIRCLIRSNRDRSVFIVAQDWRRILYIRPSDPVKVRLRGFERPDPTLIGPYLTQGMGVVERINEYIPFPFHSQGTLLVSALPRVVTGTWPLTSHTPIYSPVLFALIGLPFWCVLGQSGLRAWVLRLRDTADMDILSN